MQEESRLLGAMLVEAGDTTPADISDPREVIARAEAVSLEQGLLGGKK